MDAQRNEGVASPTRVIGKAELFFGFSKIGLLGFGGVQASARYVIVEDRRWLTETEFAAVLGIGQILPGPNVTNAAVMIGDRFQGPVGALLCVVGIMLAPLVIVTALGAAYARYAGLPDVSAAIAGAAAGAAGMILGTGLKMARKLRLSPPFLLVVAAAVFAEGVMQWPLVPVLAGLVPLGIAVAVFERSRQPA